MKRPADFNERNARFRCWDGRPIGMRSFVRRVGGGGGYSRYRSRFHADGRIRPASRDLSQLTTLREPRATSPDELVSDVALSFPRWKSYSAASFPFECARFASPRSKAQGCFRDISSQAASLQNCTNVKMRGEMKKRDLARF